MSGEESLEMAREIKAYCEITKCRLCVLYLRLEKKCMLSDEFPCDWNLPEEEMSECNEDED
jgi:hypothetical protein